MGRGRYSAPDLAKDNPWYSKCSKILKHKMLVIWVEIHKTLVEILKREDPDQTASSEAVHQTASSEALLQK